MTDPFGAVLVRYRETTTPRRSQSKLAELAGYDHSYISRLESGARMPTREAVDRIGEALRLDQGEREHLLHAAGFLKEDDGVFLRDPQLKELREILFDPTMPDAYVTTMRSGIQTLIDGARFVSERGAQAA